MEEMTTICKKRAIQAMDYFLNTLSFVPADKLTWSPTATAKSALQIAAHCAGYSEGFAAVIRASKFPDSAEEFLGPIESAINRITTVEQAETMLRKGIADTVAALDALKPEQVESFTTTPQGQTPFTFFMTIPAFHLEGHATQIDYLQTCWGDQEVHFPGKK